MTAHARELTVLGTAGQSPTRERSQSSYVLRWNDELIVFDPGEGTQRQLLHAEVHTARITRVCITHLHGDHCLGLAGMVQRRRLLGARRPLVIHHGSWATEGIERLLHGNEIDFDLGVELRPHEPGTTERVDGFDLTALALDHTTDTVGWRLEDLPARHMLPDRLEALGVRGFDIGRLAEEGSVDTGKRTVTLDEVSEVRPGVHSFAFVMDTRWCDNALRLAEGVDLLVCEATYLDVDRELAAAHGHLTAAEAARLAVEAGARRLVLSHYSERYTDLAPFRAEAEAIHPDVVVAEDLTVVPVPA